MNLDTIQQDIASLPPDAQQIIVELVEVIKKRYLLNQHKSSENSLPDWSDFIGCIEAETDLSKNYKNYLDRELNQKYDHNIQTSLIVDFGKHQPDPIGYAIPTAKKAIAFEK